MLRRLQHADASVPGHRSVGAPALLPLSDWAASAGCIGSARRPATRYPPKVTITARAEILGAVVTLLLRRT